MPTLPLVRRDDDDIYCNYWGCYSYASYVIKWVVFGGLIGAFFLFFLVGYIHARQRMKTGLAPLSYHRWMIRRRRRMAFHAAHPNLPNPFIAQQQHSWYNYTPGYGMHAMHNANGPPPPQYGTPEWLPAYQPPADGNHVNRSKTNPNQTYVAEMGTGNANGTGPAGRS